MPRLHIDHTPVEVRRGATLLEAARSVGIDVPTLCHHPGLEPQGGCRLCLVEITRPSWEGWSKLVVSCMYPAEDELTVLTRSPQVMDTRRVVLDLLLARCPEVRLVRELAAQYGVERTSYRERPERTDCILCGRCTRVCQKMGWAAISSVGRGSQREIAAPFHVAPPDCVGCLSCARICPTGCIPFIDGAHRRRIWGRDFRLLSCKRCGAPTITEEMARSLAAKASVPPSSFSLCEQCKRRELEAKIVALSA